MKSITKSAILIDTHNDIPSFPVDGGRGKEFAIEGSVHAGIDAIGIGSDFDGVECTPSGLDDVSKFPNLTRALLEKGYSAQDIKKIYGGNTLRMMRQVEKVSEELQAR